MDQEIINALRAIFQAKKSLAVVPQREAKPHKGTSALRLLAAIEIDGIVREGVYLFGRTLARSYEQDLTFGLKVEYAHVPHLLARIDWRPKKPHTDNIGSIADRKSFSGSNWHPFEDNARYGLIALRGLNLPKAIPLLPDAESTREFYTLAGRLMNIVNTETIPMPPWDTQGSLL